MGASGSILLYDAPGRALVHHVASRRGALHRALLLYRTAPPRVLSTKFRAFFGGGRFRGPEERKFFVLVQHHFLNAWVPASRATTSPAPLRPLSSNPPDKVITASACSSAFYANFRRSVVGAKQLTCRPSPRIPPFPQVKRVDFPSTRTPPVRGCGSQGDDMLVMERVPGPRGAADPRRVGVAVFADPLHLFPPSQPPLRNPAARHHVWQGRQGPFGRQGCQGHHG